MYREIENVEIVHTVHNSVTGEQVGHGVRDEAIARVVARAHTEHTGVLHLVVSGPAFS